MIYRGYDIHECAGVYTVTSKADPGAEFSFPTLKAAKKNIDMWKKNAKDRSTPRLRYDF
jgi:hypothetical protein